MPRALGETSDGGPIRARVAVVGSGLAGAEVATYLAARGHDVVVLESGRDGFDRRHQDLAEADLVGRPHRAWSEESDFHGYLAPEYRGLSRVRQLGGTSTIWTGKWRPFERRHVEGRPWLPDSRWPIPFEDLRAAYAEVARDYRLGVGDGEVPGGDLGDQAVAFRGAGWHVLPFSQHPTPLRTAEALRAGRPNLAVLVDATATRIDLAEGSDRAASVTCRSLGGAERRVEAEHVVLAAGGFETPRLLLASRHQRSAGLGNEHDLVGRFYQDHLKVKSIRLAPGPLLAGHAAAVQTTPRPRTMLSFGLPPEEQGRLGVADATLFLRPVYRGRLGRVLDLAALRRPARDGAGALDHYAVTLAVEQVVNRDSRVRLGTKLDGVGMPRVEVDWRLTDLDRHGFDASVRALDALLRASGFGRADLASLRVEEATDAAHHMGTTRMGASPREGVVDPDCAVWGIPNLHVASSSVFPTGAAYSPTFTIVALARRLARRLDALLARPGAEAATPRRSA